VGDINKDQYVLMVVLALVAGIMGGAVLSQFFVGHPAFAEEGLEQDLWWIPEYPTLIKAVERATEHTLSTSYKTDYTLHAKVELLLSKKPNNGFSLKIRLPKEATSSFYPQRGDEIPGDTRPVITIRDHDLDGLLDDFKIEPPVLLTHKGEFTKDGFIKYGNGPVHQAVLIYWAIGVGYSINHFLHGIDSAVP